MKFINKSKKSYEEKIKSINELKEKEINYQNCSIIIRKANLIDENV